MPAQSDGDPIPTGLPELDSILAGGYAANRIHLIEGQPGCGKTTLALQFLLAGNARGLETLYITLSETNDELRHVARTHGWSLDGIKLFELIPPELSLDPDREQSIVYSSDLELGETVQMVMDEVSRMKPALVVFDSLSEIRLLAQNPLRYRRQVLALKHFFSLKGCTVLFLDDLTSDSEDLNLHSLAHGVVRLEQLAVVYGAERRRLRVYKMRGRSFRGGFHDYVIRTGGLEVFPRLVASEHHRDFDDAAVPTGLVELDSMLGGGLERGTSLLLLGPSGAGKSSLAQQFVHSLLRKNERCLFVSFDETQRTFSKRALGMGMDFRGDLESGRLAFLQIDPAERSPGELTGILRNQVEERKVGAVVLDSLNGYQNAMSEEQYMLLQMHELLTYLNQQGVITILVVAQHGLVGPMQTTVDLTYLSDGVVLLRFFEAGGDVRRAISMLKKRTGGHDSKIREYRIDSGGVRVGNILSDFHGVLTGVPVFAGTASQLLEDRNEAGA
jgi:circadian clock protein KaiC